MELMLTGVWQGNQCRQRWEKEGLFLHPIMSRFHTPCIFPELLSGTQSANDELMVFLAGDAATANCIPNNFKQECFLCVW